MLFLNFLGKKYLDTFYKSPQYMLFIIGSINSTVLLLYDTIAFYINDEYSGVILGFRDNIDNFKNFCYFFLELIIKFVDTFGIWITIFFHSFTFYNFRISFWNYKILFGNYH